MTHHFHDDVGSQDETSSHDVDTTDVMLRARVDDLERQVVTLREGLQTRQRIGFVTGVLGQRYHLQPDAAWGLLAQVSQTLNVKVHRVAEVLLDAYCGRLAPADALLAARVSELLPQVPSSSR